MKSLIIAFILGFGLSAKAAKPLVVLLHGCGQSAAEIVRLTGFDQLAEENDFLIYTPEQSAVMNPFKCWNWFSSNNQHRGLVGETVSIVEAVRKIQRNYEVDRRRIYVVGFSAGAGLSLNLLYCFPEVFAGAAVHSGPVFGVANNSVKAKKVMANGSGLDGMDLRARALECSGLSPNQLARKQLVILQGSDDEVVHSRNAYEIKAQFPGKARLVLFEGLGHAWDNSSGEIIIDELGLRR